jgi:hypothetical protein
VSEPSPVLSFMCRAELESVGTDTWRLPLPVVAVTS